jgi:hypothetical protein
MVSCLGFAFSEYVGVSLEGRCEDTSGASAGDHYFGRSMLG